MNPKNYQDGSNVRKLVTRLRRELQHAVQRATQTTHGIQTSGSPSTTPAPSTGNNHLNTLNHAVSSQTMTSTIRTANQTWPSPWPLPTNAQTTNPTTHDTTTVLPTDDNHSKTHNHTAPPITAKHKTPPTPYNVTFINDTSNSDPLPRPKMINHAPTISPSLTREQSATPDNENNTRNPSSSTYGSASSSTIAPTPNLTNTLDNMTKPTAHTPNHSPTSFTTPSKMRWSQEEYNAYQWQEDTRGAAAQNTTYLTSEGNTTRENNNNLLPPSPPNEPAPTFTRTPAPPPDEQQHEYGPLPDDKGITFHRDQRRYKVTLTCTYCRTQYTTKWGEGDEPYRELRYAKWQQGRDGSGNYTWQRARCPNYYQDSGGRQNVQRQLALKY